jgi:hypothetical protein
MCRKIVKRLPAGGYPNNNGHMTLSPNRRVGFSPPSKRSPIMAG